MIIRVSCYSVFPPLSCKTFFPYEEGMMSFRSTSASLMYYGVFSSDIAPATDRQEKNATPPTSRNPECNSRCKRRPPPPQEVRKQSSLMRWKERLCLPPPSQITYSAEWT
ncbi:hypothetical protein TNCV_957801 [Trichonephila clavipes]|nr:hypothetical protein TNCV_957801 [Trichonephila clavipes]